MKNNAVLNYNIKSVCSNHKRNITLRPTQGRRIRINNIHKSTIRQLSDIQIIKFIPSVCIFTVIRSRPFYKVGLKTINTTVLQKNVLLCYSRHRPIVLNKIII